MPTTYFINRPIWNRLPPPTNQLRYAGRPELACPAVGIGQLHKQEIEQLLRDTFQPTK